MQIKFPDVKPETIKAIRNELKKYTSVQLIDSITACNAGWYVTIDNGYYIFDKNIRIVDYSTCSRCV